MNQTQSKPQSKKQSKKHSKKQSKNRKGWDEYEYDHEVEQLIREHEEKYIPMFTEDEIEEIIYFESRVESGEEYMIKKITGKMMNKTGPWNMTEEQYAKFVDDLKQEIVYFTKILDLFEPLSDGSKLNGEKLYDSGSFRTPEFSQKKSLFFSRFSRKEKLV